MFLEPRNPGVWFATWLAVSALLASSVIAYSLGYQDGLGWPLFKIWKFYAYPPWSAAVWWWHEHNRPEFMDVFNRGLRNTGVMGVVITLLIAQARNTWGPMPAVETEEQPDRYGSVNDLLEDRRFSLKQRGIALGRYGRKIVYATGDEHVLLIGASRVGEKGVSVVLPTCADYPHSLVVFDPKGELHAATADERAKLGPVYLFDPTRPGTDRFNPLLELRDDERNIGDCRALGTLMTVGMEGRDPFWATKAAELGAAVARIVCTDGGPRTLARMREIAIEIATDRFRMPPGGDPWAAQIIGEIMSMTSERGVRPGVQAQLMLALQSAGDPLVAHATSGSSFKVADICAGERPVTVYITLPPSQYESLQHLARLAINSLFLGMTHDRALASDGRPKRRPTLALIDEFPALGFMPFIERALAQVAGWGLRVMLVAQSVEQIASTYGTNESILGNMGTLLWVPSFSRGTHEQVTAAAGTIIATLRARHRKVGVLNERPSETVSQSRHPVINMREAQQLGRDHILVLPPHGVPVWLEKARFFEMPWAYGGRIKDVRAEYQR
jgi:type IV secretion system protein VirD4